MALVDLVKVEARVEKPVANRRQLMVLRNNRMMFHSSVVWRIVERVGWRRMVAVINSSGCKKALAVELGELDGRAS